MGHMTREQRERQRRIMTPAAPAPMTALGAPSGQVVFYNRTFTLTSQVQLPRVPGNEPLIAFLDRADVQARINAKMEEGHSARFVAALAAVGLVVEGGALVLKT